MDTTDFGGILPPSPEVLADIICEEPFLRKVRCCKSTSVNVLVVMVQIILRIYAGRNLAVTECQVSSHLWQTTNTMRMGNLTFGDNFQIFPRLPSPLPLPELNKKIIDPTGLQPLQNAD